MAFPGGTGPLSSLFHPLIMWLLSMQWYELILILFIISFTLIIIFYLSHSFYLLVFLSHWSIWGLIYPSHCSYTSHYQFNLLFSFFSLVFSHWTDLGPLFMRFSLHIASYTWGYGFDYWVFKPSFPSFLLPYRS